MLPLNAQLSGIPKAFYSDVKGTSCFPWVHGQCVPSKRDRTPQDRDLQPKPGPANAQFSPPLMLEPSRRI